MMTPFSNYLFINKRLLLILSVISLYLPVAFAQDAPLSEPESLMDKMTGEWVMTGSIEKQQVTHDVNVDWILNRQYIRIHEISREKNDDGDFAYEAWIHIVWDQENKEYAVMWLDNTARTNFAAEGVGHAKPDGDRIPFEWRSEDGSGIRNTFSYDRTTDRWSWRIENIDKSGQLSSFANLILKRK